MLSLFFLCTRQNYPGLTALAFNASHKCLPSALNPSQTHPGVKTRSVSCRWPLCLNYTTWLLSPLFLFSAIFVYWTSFDTFLHPFQTCLNSVSNWRPSLLTTFSTLVLILIILKKNSLLLTFISFFSFISKVSPPPALTTNHRVIQKPCNVWTKSWNETHFMIASVE